MDYASTNSNKRINRRHARNIDLLRGSSEYNFYGNDTSTKSVKSSALGFDSASRTITNFYFKVATFHLTVKRHRYAMRQELKCMKKLNKRLRKKGVDVEADYPEFYELIKKLTALRRTIKQEIMESLKLTISNYLDKSERHGRAKDVLQSLQAKGVDGRNEEEVKDWIQSEYRMLRDTWNAHVDFINTHRNIMLDYMNADIDAQEDCAMTIMHRILNKYSAMGEGEAADVRMLTESKWIYKTFATGTISLMSGS